MTLLSTAAVAVQASSTSAPQQQMWYPEFASDYESGRCTQSPSPAMSAFAASSALDSHSELASNDKEGCCAAWFPHQELCGCLGVCPDGEQRDENDDARQEDDVVAAPSAASPAGGSTANEALAEEYRYWYPKFDVTYESGRCVKPGVNTADVPPTYYTKEGGFLHMTLDACCDAWFGDQEAMACLNSLDVASQPTPSAGVNVTVAMESVVVDSEPEVGYRQAGLAVEETV